MENKLIYNSVICLACGGKEERKLSMHDCNEAQDCDYCGTPMKKKISATKPAAVKTPSRSARTPANA